MRGFEFTIFILLAIVLACGAEDQGAQDPNRIDNTLINGTVVDPNDPRWFTTVKIVTGSAGCTATVVGPRALLTAAHCAGDGSTSRFSFKGKEYSAKMTRSSLYPGRDHDIAIGVMNEAFPVQPTTIDFERLEIEEVVTLSGYGCTRAGGGGTDGRLRYGDSVVVGRTTWDTVTREPGGAALCYGDSGGPLWKDKKLVGVNSKGNIATTSYLARMDLTQSKDFFKAWSERTGQPICGLNGTKEQCGEGVEPPPGGEKFVLENVHVLATIELKPNSPHSAVVVKRLFQMIMDFLAAEPKITDLPNELIITDKAGISTLPSYEP